MTPEGVASKMKKNIFFESKWRVFMKIPHQ